MGSAGSHFDGTWTLSGCQPCGPIATDAVRGGAFKVKWPGGLPSHARPAMKSRCWRFISLADWRCYETAEDEGDATDRERQREASGPFTNEAEEIRPNSAAEIAGAVD